MIWGAAGEFSVKISHVNVRWLETALHFLHAELENSSEHRLFLWPFSHVISALPTHVKTEVWQENLLVDKWGHYVFISLSLAMICTSLIPMLTLTLRQGITVVIKRSHSLVCDCIYILPVQTLSQLNTPNPWWLNIKNVLGTLCFKICYPAVFILVLWTCALLVRPGKGRPFCGHRESTEPAGTEFPGTWPLTLMNTFSIFLVLLAFTACLSSFTYLSHCHSVFSILSTGNSVFLYFLYPMWRVLEYPGNISNEHQNSEKVGVILSNLFS